MFSHWVARPLTEWLLTCVTSVHRTSALRRPTDSFVPAAAQRRSYFPAIVQRTNRSPTDNCPRQFNGLLSGREKVEGGQGGGGRLGNRPETPPPCYVWSPIGHDSDDLACRWESEEGEGRGAVALEAVASWKWALLSPARLCLTPTKVFFGPSWLERWLGKAVESAGISLRKNLPPLLRMSDPIS